MPRKKEVKQEDPEGLEDSVAGNTLDQVLKVIKMMKPMTPLQKARLRYWDYFLYEVEEGLMKQRREKTDAEARGSLSRSR